jgi:hypothetical protein
MSSIFPKLKNNSELNGFEAWVDRAKSATTFWGGRYVTIEIENKTHFVSLRSFANYFRKQAYYCIVNKNDFNKDHRLQSLKIVKKLAALNEETSVKIKNSNIITRIFNYLRESISIMDIDWEMWILTDLICSYTPKEIEERKKIESNLKLNDFKVQGHELRKRVDEKELF